MSIIVGELEGKILGRSQRMRTEPNLCKEMTPRQPKTLRH